MPVLSFKNLFPRLMALASYFFLVWPLKSQAQSYNFADNSGLQKTADAAGFLSKWQNWTPENLASNVLLQILTWLGIAFLGMMIYGGVIWMTGEGNEAKATKAKNIITGGITGLIIVFLAYAISYFVISYFGGKTIN